jgi:hypothetical protein
MKNFVYVDLKKVVVIKATTVMIQMFIDIQIYLDGRVNDTEHKRYSLITLFNGDNLCDKSMRNRQMGKIDFFVLWREKISFESSSTKYSSKT